MARAAPLRHAQVERPDTRGLARCVALAAAVGPTYGARPARADASRGAEWLAHRARLLDAGVAGARSKAAGSVRMDLDTDVARRPRATHAAPAVAGAAAGAGDARSRGLLAQLV